MTQRRRRKYHELLDTPHIVYIMRGVDDMAIYVGVTRLFGPRFQTHICSKPWWLEVRTIAVEHHMNGTDAHLREIELINLLSPQHNTVRADYAYAKACTRPFRPQRPKHRATTCPKCNQIKERLTAPYCNACYREYKREWKARPRHDD